MSNDRRHLIAQWAFDTRAILGRFHLWLKDVELRSDGNSITEGISFVGGPLERAFVMATAVTALGTKLFGRWGEGAGLDKAGINRVKKDADAVSAYALSEALWYLTRSLPENHAVMISLGEGLMPKAGETPEMGSNPLLGFGRVYARPQVARFLDRRVHRLVNDPSYEWPEFWLDLQTAGITVWGAAVDTLENTSRFAKGSPTGAMTVLHLFDQPLKVARPYEGYMGNLVLPREVVERAADRSILIDFRTPRAKVMEAIRETYPEIRPENVHVWTLGGSSRADRLSALWSEWQSLGVHLVEDGWTCPKQANRSSRSPGPTHPSSASGLLPVTTVRPTFSCATAMQLRPRPCRPRASTRSSISPPRCASSRPSSRRRSNASSASSASIRKAMTSNHSSQPLSTPISLQISPTPTGPACGRRARP